VRVQAVDDAGNLGRPATVRTVAGRAPDTGSRRRVREDPEDDPSRGDQVDDGGGGGADLPFTGLSLLALVAAGLALAATGRLLRARASE